MEKSLRLTGSLLWTAVLLLGASLLWCCSVFSDVMSLHTVVVNEVLKFVTATPPKLGPGEVGTCSFVALSMYTIGM
jgi:hypothetical protein